MHRRYLFILTAAGEVGTGLALVLRPSFPLSLLLGAIEVGPEISLVARLAGAALLAIGVASWLTRASADDSAQVGLLVGLLIYDVAAAALLAYAGLMLGMVGIALWPAVVIHGVLAIWSGWVLRANPTTEIATIRQRP